MSRQTPHPAPGQYTVLEPGDTYECGPLYIERDTADTRRRALIEARCEPPPEERTQPDDLKQLDLLRIAVNSFAFNQQPRRYGSRFARHQAESARATASIAALLADGALLRRAGHKRRARAGSVRDEPTRPGTMARRKDRPRLTVRVSFETTRLSPQYLPST